MKAGIAVGLAWALLSSFCFALAGPLAASLLDAGWSPGAVALTRVTGGAALLVPLAWSAARRWRATAAAARHLIAYGVFAVAGVQICFFSAVERLDVAVALLVEYSAPLLVVCWLWARRGVRPTGWTLLGAALAAAGLALVLDVGSADDIDAVGLVWAVCAAACLASYFVLSDSVVDGPPPVVTAAAGTAVGALALGLAGLVRLTQVNVAAGDVVLSDRELSPVVPLALLVVACTVVSYLSGIRSVRILGSQPASFVSLTEVVFAAVLAAAVVGQHLGLRQVLGIAVVLSGIVLVQATSRREVTPTMTAPGS